jgi:hypothetical protein
MMEQNIETFGADFDLNQHCTPHTDNDPGITAGDVLFTRPLLRAA